MAVQLPIPARPHRKFLTDDFKVTSWDALKPYFDKLLQFNIDSEISMVTWLRHRSELESVISEDAGWRYIRMTCYTENEDYRNSYQDFVQNIQPNMAPIADELNKKAMATPFLATL